MNKSNWKDIAELIGIAAIVASLIFVGLQMQQTQNIALNELRYDQIDRKIDLEGLTYQHADIWVRGNAGEELDPVEIEIYDGLVDAKWANAFWNTLTLRQLGRSYKRSIHDFAWFLYRNPGARQSWETGVAERRIYLDLLQNEAEAAADEFVVELWDLIYTDLEKLDQSNAQN